MQPILERLIEARKNTGLNQGQVAKLIGLAAPSSFTGIERGDNALTLERFLLLCDIYDVSPTWVLTGTNPNFDIEAFGQAFDQAAIHVKDAAKLMRLMQSLKPAQPDSEGSARNG